MIYNLGGVAELSMVMTAVSWRLLPKSGEQVEEVSLPPLLQPPAPAHKKTDHWVLALHLDILSHIPQFALQADI
jgi:hypothetical protein